MSKELRALNRMLLNCDYYEENIDYDLIEAALLDYEVLKQNFASMRDFKYKKLDAFEIIKAKQVAVDEFIRCCKTAENPLKEYNDFAGDDNALTQEDFELLKEVLYE